MIHETQGRAIGYEVRGEGPAVVLLHPFPFDRRYWAKTSLPGFRVISVDARGYGDSSLSGEVTIDDLADDVLTVLDHLGIPMAAVLGLSMGGYVALSIAARHPHRLSGLVLADTRAGADGETARANRNAAAAEIREHGPSSFLDDTAVRLCGRSASDAMRSRVQKLAAKSSPDFAHALPATLLALRDRPDRTSVLSELRLPVLVVVGEEDVVTPPDDARAMKRAIPGAQLVELASAGHLTSLEVSEDFERTVTAFLESNLLAT